MEKYTGIKLFFMISAVLIYSCKKPLLNDDTLKGKRTINNFVFTDTEKGSVNWKMYADSAHIVETAPGFVIKAENVRVVFYKNEVEDSFLEADEAEYKKDEEMVYTSGRVFMHSEEKKIITSDVTWDLKQEKLYTEKPVVIDSAQGRLEGIGMVSDLSFSEIELKSMVQGSIKNAVSSD